MGVLFQANVPKSGLASKATSSGGKVARVSGLIFDLTSTLELASSTSSLFRVFWEALEAVAELDAGP